MIDAVTTKRDAPALVRRLSGWGRRHPEIPVLSRGLHDRGYVFPLSKGEGVTTDREGALMLTAKRP
jgi:hypothetical protein